MAVKVLIVDDHAIIRDGLRAILEASDDIAVVGSAADGREAVRMAAAAGPDVVIMDIAMPGLNGIEAIRILGERLPATATLVLSMHNTGEHIHRALAAGARGYLLKESAGAEVVAAVRAVSRGALYFGRNVDRPVGKAHRQKSPLESLSSREREVLQLVVEGSTSAAIAQRLALSPKSVETYRSRIMHKLAVKDVPSLVKFAIANGITPPA